MAALPPLRALVERLVGGVVVTLAGDLELRGVFLEEGAGIVASLVEVDGQQAQAHAAVARRHLVHPGERLLAGSTPRGPEVEIAGLAAVVGQLDGGAGWPVSMACAAGAAASRADRARMAQCVWMVCMMACERITALIMLCGN